MSTSNYSRFSDDSKSSGQFPRLNPLPGLHSTQIRKLNVQPTTTRSGSYPLPPVVSSPKPGAHQRRMGHWKWLVTAAALSSAMVAFEPWKKVSSESAVIDTPAQSQRSVEIARPSSTATASVVLPATVRPWQTTGLTARVSGYLKSWKYDLGDHVKSGDLLAEIDTPELDQDLAAAEALAREADAAAAQARAERVEAEADLKVAEAQVDRVKAELDLAQTQLDRRTKLLASKVVAQEEFDTFQRQFEARTAEHIAAKSELQRRRVNLETRTAVIAVRDATAKSREATVNRYQELQTFKRIVAPFDGVITRRNAEVGMLINAGREVLFSLEDTGRVRVTINVPQSHSMQVAVGVDATISLPESPSTATTAKVTRVADSVESATRTMLAEVELSNEVARLQPGSYAQVALRVQPRDAVWSIPANTVSMRVQGPHVAVVNDQNRIELRPIALGRDLGNRVIVAQGINGDERLVVNPRDDLVNGIEVVVGQKDFDNPQIAHK